MRIQHRKQRIMNPAVLAAVIAAPVAISTAAVKIVISLYALKDVSPEDRPAVLRALTTLLNQRRGTRALSEEPTDQGD
ncbi:hypothetical protein ACFYTS_29725 [Nocardia sp. NPDC004151]|uniref:hypothetical protein n=1 Tax=Nocardia sp. NPDC004151 TaxID=3364304 RepID=UPI0036B75AB9